MSRFVTIPARFDKTKDRHEVDQFGFVDVHRAYTQGVIDGATTYDDNSFNKADPTAMLHRPHDIFEAMRQADYVKAALSAANADNPSKTD